MSNGYTPHVDWWRDGKIVIQILTMLLGFGATIFTIVYQGGETRDQVVIVQKDTAAAREETKTNAQRIEAIHKDVKDTNIRMKLPPSRE